MSIYTAMRAGVSGLSANASALAAISDNVANINTTAYKRNVSDFTAMVNGQGGSQVYSAGGVLSGVSRMVNMQGSLEQGRGSTAFAVQGRGFFIVAQDPDALQQGGAAVFTRSGNFAADAEGYLRNAQGYVLQGWPIGSDGSVVSSPTSLSVMQSVQLANVGGAAAPTGRSLINANLNAAQVAHDTATTPYNSGDLATGTIQPHFETTIEIFDSLGRAKTVAVGFLKTGPNEWQVEAYTRPASAVAAAGGLLADGTMTFTPTGQVDTVTGTIGGPFTITWDPATGAADQDLTLALSDGLTQFAIGFGVNSVVTDGAPPGQLVGVNLEDNGILTAQFSNGRSRSIYQIPLATFLNPNGLLADQGGVYRQTLESGVFTINAPGAGGAGAIESGALEASNVDLGTEFTNMIQTQRAYSASSRIITTADEMLEELIRIKR